MSLENTYGRMVNLVEIGNRLGVDERDLAVLVEQLGASGDEVTRETQTELEDILNPDGARRATRRIRPRA